MSQNKDCPFLSTNYSIFYSNELTCQNCYFESVTACISESGGRSDGKIAKSKRRRYLATKYTLLDDRRSCFNTIFVEEECFIKSCLKE